MTNCTFSDNSAGNEGGAILCDSSSPTVTNCIFSGNSADWSGGALFCDSSSPTVTNCIFSGNSANDEGGAIFCGGSSPSITNCTLSDNSANSGRAFFCIDSDVTLNNCILWDGGNEIEVLTGSAPTLNYCCVDDTGLPGDVTQNNCIYDDPQFVDAANGDYHLKDTSPCIDKGDNTYISGVNEDLDGNERVVDGDNDGTATVDIGAYEKQ